MNKEIDIKLLKVIHALVTTGTVTETGKLLNQSAGNISYQLNKVRKLTGRHLFIRTKTGMRPDAMAMELSQRYSKYIEGKEGEFSLSAAGGRNELRISTWAMIEMMFNTFSVKPVKGLQHYSYLFSSLMMDKEERVARLRKNMIDIDIGTHLPMDDSFRTIKLFTSSVRVLTGRYRAKSGEPYCLGEWLEASKVAWSCGPDYYYDNTNAAVSAEKYMLSSKSRVISGNLDNMVSFCVQNDCAMVVPAFLSHYLEANFDIYCHRISEYESMHCDVFLHYSRFLFGNTPAMAIVDELIAFFRHCAMSFR